MSDSTKLCGCGCGQALPPRRYGRKPPRFVQGHSGRLARARARGNRIVQPDGYVIVLRPDHERADAQGYVLEHVMVASSALGRAVPSYAHVHHVNGNRQDNRPANLVVCENAAYHQLLHRRARAIRESGDAGFMKCETCGCWDNPAGMYVDHKRNRARHRSCHARAERGRRFVEALHEAERSTQKP